MSDPKLLLHEEVIIASILQGEIAELPQTIARVLAFAPEAWTSPECGAIAAAIRKAYGNGQGCNIMTLPALLSNDKIAALARLASDTAKAFPLDLAELEAQALLEHIVRRRIIATLGEAWQEAKGHPERAKSVAEHVRDALASLSDEAPRSLAEFLKEREFKAEVQPPPLRTIYTLAGQTISTPGNLMTITSQIKTGKSAVIGAMAAAAMQHPDEADLLGFNSGNPNNAALVWFDTEQSLDDSWHCARRAFARAGLKQPPPWFHQYCLTGANVTKVQECLQKAARINRSRHGGLHSILLDGVADFVEDVNDPAETKDFVTQLHDMAIHYECPIICVIHFNPGSDKSRGHLGSQLERKAETNLRLDKGANVTTIWSEKQRRAPIPKEKGVCFAWNDEAGMHITVPNTYISADEQERRDLAALAKELFSHCPSMSYGELVAAVKAKLKVSESTAERRVKRLRQLGFIKKCAADAYKLAT